MGIVGWGDVRLEDGMDEGFGMDRMDVVGRA